MPSPTFCYSPHIPRRGAPQGQGPGSLDSPSRAAPETAKTDSSFSTCGLEQFLHLTSAFDEYEIFSNFDPQSRHWYSKIGIFLLLNEYIQAPQSFQFRPAVTPPMLYPRLLNGFRMRELQANEYGA
jgi:hypothetical protein